MTAINTVFGPVNADQLGITLMHEHIVIGSAYEEYSAKDIRMLVKIALNAVEDAKSYGVRTIVDAGPGDLGRSIEVNRIVASETGVNIIASTGMYMHPQELPVTEGKATVESEAVERLYDRFMRDITSGIGASDIKAGAIKVATSYDCIYAYEMAILKAAARASRDTGAPIITHTQDGTMGPEQAKLLVAERADPRKVVIGHMCGSSNLEYHVKTLENDVSLAFDRWGLNVIYPDVMRQATLTGLLGIGFAERIVLSHDHIPQWKVAGSQVPAAVKPLIAEWSYSHIFRNIIPRLKSAGVTENQIETMLIDNPRRIFE